MRYLGDGFIACPSCEGYGVDVDDPYSGDCPRCDGAGSLLLEQYAEPLQPRGWAVDTTVWSPLLCDPETIERMTA